MKMRDKLLTTWPTLVAVASVLVLAICLVAIQGIGALRGVLTNLGNPLNLILVVCSLGVALSATVGMLCIGRWYAMADKQAEGLQRQKTHEQETEGLKAHIADLSANLQGVADAVLQLLRVRGAQVMADTAEAWANFVTRMDSYNPSFGRELRAMARGGYVVDPARLQNFLQRLLDPKMVLTYVIFVPRRLGFGAHPIDTALRLVAIYQACRALAAAQGKALGATTRVFLIDGPRPVGSFFLTARVLADEVRPIALQYSRSFEPGGRDIPTADRTIIEHSDAEVDRLGDFYDEKVGASMEIAFADLEAILSPLLQPDGLVDVDLEQVTAALYDEAMGERTDVIECLDHLVFTPVRPSRFGLAPEPRKRAAPVVQAPSEAPKDWSRKLVAGVRDWVRQVTGGEGQNPRP